MKKIKTVVLTREKILNILDIIERNIITSLIPSLIDLEKHANGNYIVSSLMFSSLNFKNDKEFFNKLQKFIEIYKDNISLLKVKASEDLPDTITLDSKNINIRLFISMLSIGSYLVEKLPNVLSYLIVKYYKKDDNNLNISASDIRVLKTILENSNKVDISVVVNTIGKVPVFKTGSLSTTSVIEEEVPLDIVETFFKKSLSINDKTILEFMKNMLSSFREDNNIKVEFIGDPIYHIRLLLVDLEAMHLDSLKESSKNLELRILELKNKNVDKKAIEYYENKLKNINAKIERYLED